MTDTKDMRLDFEQHIRDSIVSERGENLALKTDEFGHYATLWVSDRWVGWQAATERATALERERCAVLIETYPQWLGLVAKEQISTAIRQGSTT